MDAKTRKRKPRPYQSQKRTEKPRRFHQVTPDPLNRHERLLLSTLTKHERYLQAVLCQLGPSSTMPASS